MDHFADEFIQPTTMVMTTRAEEVENNASPKVMQTGRKG